MTTSQFFRMKFLNFIHSENRHVTPQPFYFCSIIGNRNNTLSHTTLWKVTHTNSKRIAFHAGIYDSEYVETGL